MPETSSIPGLRDLWRLTLGDPRVCVAVLDGPAVLDHPCLRGANVRRLRSYWLDDGADVEDGLVEHATHVCSVLFSPHDTDVLGLAPRCRGLSIPVQTGGMTDAYNVVRALDAARDAGADIIHVAVVQPTQSGTAESLLERAVRTCLDEGILVVSPAGNDRGECWTMPAAIPGVLAVGAMNDEGQPFQFSNYGGILQSQGVLAPGENILGADPDGGTRKHKGTSCAAPIVTGVAALLMSLQKLQGREPSAEEIRRAILDSAIPCDPREVDEPGRCLRGKLNIPGASAIILGPPPGRGLWPWREMAWRDVLRAGSQLAEIRSPISQRLERGSVAVYFPTAPAVVDRMLELADPKRGEVLYDLGCGDGRVVIAAAKRYGVRAVGFDRDPVRVHEARENVRRHGVEDLVAIEQADILSLDLRGANIITLFLQVVALILLTPELKKLKHGSRIVSYGYPIPGVQPTKVETVPTKEGLPSDSFLFLYLAPLSFDQPMVATRTPSAAIGSDVNVSGVPTETEVQVSPAKKRLIYALGTIGYDFGTESRRDTFKQLMPPVEVGGMTVPANPYDPRQMSDYLARNPSEARSLVWTLHQEQTPVYALKPVGPFGHQVYETLRLLLASQVDAAGSDASVERVSVPAERIERALRLFSGQVVPVVKLRVPRGLYGWQVDDLIEDALAAAAPDLGGDEAPRVRRALRGFLDRVYHDLKNPGDTSKDRALNFAATNAFQAAEAFPKAVAEGRQLKSIEVVKSPVCRLDSDRWDVKLKFFDPEHGQRAKRVCRLTVDVSDLMPVTLGEVRTWMTRD